VNKLFKKLLNKSQIILLLICTLLILMFGLYKYLQYHISNSSLSYDNMDILNHSYLIESNTLNILANKELKKSYSENLDQDKIDLHINRAISLLKISLAKQPYSPVVWSAIGNLEGMANGHSKKVLEYIIMSLKTSSYNSNLTIYNLKAALALIEDFSPEQKEVIEKNICNSWILNKNKFRESFNLTADKNYICLSLKKYCASRSKYHVNKYCGQ